MATSAVTCCSTAVQRAAKPGWSLRREGPLSPSKGSLTSSVSLRPSPNTATWRHRPSAWRQGQTIRAASVVAPNAPLELEEKLDEVELKQDQPQEAELSGPGPAAPNPFEVFSLLTELCDETQIAELKLRVGKFSLHVKRDVGASKKAALPPMAPPVPSYPMVEAAGGAAIAPPPPPAPKAAKPRAYESDEEDQDEGLLFVVAPKVGIFRRGRFFKGKRGKPMVNEESMVKTGQVVCYLEQLGTQIGVESEYAGEVVGFCVEDGDTVGFGERLVKIRPSFPGIIGGLA